LLDDHSSPAILTSIVFFIGPSHRLALILCYHLAMLLLAVLVGVGVIWLGILAVMMAMGLLRPPRMSDGRAMAYLRRLSPGDLGLNFDELEFQIRDECTGRPLEIAAWWIPAENPTGKCAVLIHGYSDAKVGSIAWAPLLRSLGFSILAVDLRAHGESGGKYCTAGFWERHDLIQVLDQFRAQQPSATRQIILFGISLGAAVAAATAAMRPDFAAVILECPFADYRSASLYHAARLGAPPTIFRLLALPIAQWIAHCNFASVAPIKEIPKISAPLMLIQSGDDPFASALDIFALQSAMKERPADSISSIWKLQGVHHVVGMCDDPEAYRTKIADFLSLKENADEPPRRQDAKVENTPRDFGLD
jgi:pimeloyl-ACP methyl ester carboxylesterase